MADIEIIIDKLLKEEIGKHMCDSGGAYGYQYERNRENGCLKGLNPVEEYTDEERKERTLDITIPIYDLLTYNLSKDEGTVEFEEELFKAFEENGFEPYEIYEVEDYLQNEGADFFGIESTGITSIKYVNTYNYEEYISQTLLYVTFACEGEDYVLLEVHNRCDVRSGYTYPQLFKIEDIEYFLMGMDERFCQCECGLNDYFIFGNDTPTDSSGAYIGEDEIYERTYVDKDGHVRCKECDDIIKGGFVEW